MSELISWGLLGVTFAGVVLSIGGSWLGLALLAAEYGGILSYSLTGAGIPLYEIAGWLKGGWDFVLLPLLLIVVGFGLEPLADRFRVRVFSLSSQIIMFASVAVIVLLFLGLPSYILLGAYLGAVAGSLLDGEFPKKALVNGLGALLGVFGANGVRLLAACSMAGV
ncbi:MAG: DUF456 family protein, partial [Cyanobacteria bacterium REEB65]|nr:DUF456 family protein [Cyanobacteria bacterium REEB65]